MCYYEDLVLRLFCRLKFLSQATSVAGSDGSEKTEEYWAGLSWLVDDAADQPKEAPGCPRRRCAMGTVSGTVR